MVAVPAAFNLARHSSYSASRDIYPRPIAGYPLVSDPAYYRAFLGDRELQAQMYQNTGARPPEYANTHIALGMGGKLISIVKAETPARAQELVNALGPQLANATRRQLAQQARADETKLRGELRSRTLSAHDARLRRRQLRRAVRAVRLGPEPPERIVLGAPAGRPPIRGFADKLADSLPGAFPARRSPVWAGLAGLLVAATLWLIGLALFPPGGRRPGAESPAA
jgi:hypothetical protein